MLVKDINPGAGRSSPGWLMAVNGTLFFTAYEDTHGGELWKSDGTDAGTGLVKDIRASASSSDILPLAEVNGALFFSADDGANGQELWKSDGTVAGTALVEDINPGAGGSFPRELTAVNGTLFFAAHDGTRGLELWKLRTVVSDIDGDGVVDESDNCPSVANADQADFDGDSQGNACDLDDDNDGLPDASDPAPLDPDADEDGLPDSEDPDVVADVVAGLPDDAYAPTSSAGGNKTAMLSILNEVEQYIQAGDTATAIQKLKNLRKHVDGCGTAADKDDWIVDCAAQLKVRVLIDALIANLGGP